MVRTQLFLAETTHARLRALAQRQGRTVSDLVREAIDRAFGQRGGDERERTLRAIEGLWRDRDDLEPTREFVRDLRRNTRNRRPRR